MKRWRSTRLTGRARTLTLIACAAWSIYLVAQVTIMVFIMRGGPPPVRVVSAATALVCAGVALMATTSVFVEYRRAQPVPRSRHHNKSDA